MYKKHRVRGNLHKSDVWRVVLTDTAPAEVPIIFSNDGFYRNLHDMKNKSENMIRLLDVLLCSSKPYTKPYRYNIVKSETSTRALSLLHPGNQISISMFYDKYNHLLTYYCANSPFSIRYPHKIGSSYYFSAPISDKNKYKNNTVDTSDIEHLLKNPASYFSYKYYDRLHKFYDSKDYITLEKKYALMTMCDVSKCFHSIYTHTMSWALKDVPTSKKFTKSNMFGNVFDRLMQSGNYNETNGLCIGPETSRIFAEIIFSKIDKNIQKSLSAKGLHHKVDYDCRRYVDDYLIFCNSQQVSIEIQNVISAHLREFNLHLNEAKTEYVPRPFYTRKSRVIDKVGEALDSFIEKFTDRVEVEGEGREFLVPIRIRNHHQLSKYFIKQVKSSFLNENDGYELISNYVTSALCKRVIMLIDDHDTVVNSDSGSDLINNEKYYPAFSLLLDLIFFFFSVHPTANSSLRVANALLSSGKFLSTNLPMKTTSLSEQALYWANQLIHAPSFRELLNKGDVVPVEVLNILVSLRELSNAKLYEEPILNKAASMVNQNSYFDFICRLYIYQKQPAYTSQRQALFEDIQTCLLNEPDLLQSSEHVHLLIDVLCCPYIPVKDRTDLLKSLWEKMQKEDSSLPKLAKVSPKKLVTEFEAMPWFVNWQKIDLLNMLKKKELSAVY